MVRYEGPEARMANDLEHFPDLLQEATRVWDAHLTRCSECSRCREPLCDVGTDLVCAVEEAEWRLRLAVEGFEPVGIADRVEIEPHQVVVGDEVAAGKSESSRTSRLQAKMDAGLLRWDRHVAGCRECLSFGLHQCYEGLLLRENVESARLALLRANRPGRTGRRVPRVRAFGRVLRSSLVSLPTAALARRKE